ncbi:MAG: ATP-binding protein [Pseudomonadales bacterium]|nr:ATP-binding protein [Pseudomonadales bacterium]
MVFNRFGIQLLFRFCLMAIGIYCFIYLFNSPRFHAATLFSFLVLSVMAYELWFYINKTNHELSRFLSAARYSDFNQQFEFDDIGGGFKDLGETFTGILDKLSEQKKSQEVQIRHLSAVVEHVPTPLLSVLPNGGVVLRNSAARRLFGSVAILHVDDLQQFGDEFYQQIISARTGDKRLVKFTAEGLESQLALCVAKVSSAGKAERLVSLQDIGTELESTKLKAWQDLSKVLTHEIMNSITPIASLSQTIVDLVDDTDKQLGENTSGKRSLEDIGEAAATVARRSRSLMQFVSNYRKLTKLPEPEKSTLSLQALFDHAIRTMDAAFDNRSVRIVSSVSPASLQIYADREMIEQTLINLIRNSMQALTHNEDGLVQISAFLTSRGKVAIEVTDNGPGIDIKLINKIFVPYFTTRPEGSGIGLALARQVMIAHNGSISASNMETGGCKFVLAF